MSRIKHFINKILINKVRKVRYLFDIFIKYAKGADYTCPNCGCKKSRLVTRKYVVLQLRRCNNCFLMYKIPKQDFDENRRFYQKDYWEPGMVTEIPSEDKLAYLLDTNFKGSEKDFTNCIEAIKARKKGLLLDFGCSWGYGVWQFNKAGFRAIGYEISKARAEFGRKRLGVEILDSLEALKSIKDESFDIIFCCHVFEHLPAVNEYLALFYGLLKEKGLLIIVVPDCKGMGDERSANTKKAYAFGKNHNFAFDETFWNHSLPRLKFNILEIDGGAIIAEKGDLI